MLDVCEHGHLRRKCDVCYLTGQVAELEAENRLLRIGYLRYEALRKLNVRQFAELFARNIRGELFDTLVDELVNDGTPEQEPHHDAR